MDELIARQADLRGAVFFGTLAILLFAEMMWPRRALSRSPGRRWLGNMGIALLDFVLVWLLFPVAIIEFGVIAAEAGWGLMPRLGLPAWLALPAAFLLLDLNRYLQHLLLHRIPLLWTLHGMHHTDPDYDATTALRFHPVEAALTFAATLGFIALLGPPPAAVFAHELLAAMVVLLVHGNIALPAGLDRFLRPLLVTPDFHRVHHSREPRETDSNFGAVFSLWDRLFGTAVEQPALGHPGMRIGLPGYDSDRELDIDRMLLHPWRRAD